MALRSKDIVKGEFVRVLGLSRSKDGLLFLCEWTTGQCYIPHNLMRKYLPGELVNYYKQSARFVRV